MITWLQETFGKHHKLLLGAILVIMAVSFIFFGSNAGGSGASISDSARSYRGVDLLNAQATLRARNLASINTIFRNPGNPRSPQPLSPDGFLRIATIAAQYRQQGVSPRDAHYETLRAAIDILLKADELGVPDPDAKALDEFIRELPAFRENGAFSPAALKRTLDGARDRLQIDEGAFQSALSDFWRQRKVFMLSAPEASPGLDFLADRMSAKIRMKWTVETALLKRADHAPKSPAAEEKEIEAFFKTNAARYRIPQQFRVSVIETQGKAPGAIPPATDADLLKIADAQKWNFPLRSLSPEETFLKENRAELTKLYQEQKLSPAGAEAAVALNEKLSTLFPAGKEKPDDAHLADALKSAGLIAKPLPKYDALALPKDTGIPDELLASALRLTPENWRGDAASVGATAYVFVLDATFPSREAALAEVRDRVVHDLANERTDKSFAAYASDRAKVVAEAVKAGKPFAEAAGEGGVKVEKPEPFTADKATMPIAMHIESLSNLPVGGVSSALPSGPDFVLAHIVARADQPAAKDDKTAENLRTEVARAAAFTDAQEIADKASRDENLKEATQSPFEN